MPFNRLTRGTALVGDLQTDNGAVPKALVVSVARTDTVAKHAGTIPGDAIILGVYQSNGVASNAGTTAVVSVGILGGTGTEIVNAADVKGTGTAQVLCAKAALGPLGLSGPKTVTAKYAETGSAGTTGGPFTFTVLYL